VKKEVIKKGLDSIAKLQEPMLCWLKELLDSYYDENNPLTYYDLIAGMWLEHFMHVVYANWLHVRTLPLESYKEPILELTATPAEFAELTKDCCDYHLNLRMAIQLINKNGKPASCFQKEYANITNGIPIPQCFIFSSHGIKRKLKKWLFEAIFIDDAKVLICAPYFKILPIDWMFVMWKWRHCVRYDDLNEFISVSVKYDHDWRQRSSQDYCKSNDFLDVLKCLLPLSIPAVFLEGFKEFRTRVLSLNKTRPRIVYTANALDTHLTFKFLVAEWKKKGSLLLSHQHGGGYGLDYIHACEDYEARVSDYFYTWGWRNENCRVRPLSVGIPHYSYAKHSKQILLNCNECHKNIYRLHFQPMPGSIETITLNTIDFVAILPEHKNLLVRPYQPDRGWGFLDRVKQMAPNAKYDTGNKRPKSFKRFAQSRIVVHNTLGTGFLESMAMNIPTLCFYDQAIYEFRQKAQPYIDALQKVGILQQSGKDAAFFLLDKLPTIEFWWQQQDVQKARCAFCANYASFSPDWPQQWETEFRRVLLQDTGKIT